MVVDDVLGGRESGLVALRGLARAAEGKETTTKVRRSLPIWDPANCCKLCPICVL
jgi:hypothetical protein